MAIVVTGILVFLRINGSEDTDRSARWESNIYSTGYSDPTYSFVSVLDLSVGDYVELWAYMNVDNSRSAALTNQTLFQGLKLL